MCEVRKHPSGFAVPTVLVPRLVLEPGVDAASATEAHIREHRHPDWSTNTVHQLQLLAGQICAGLQVTGHPSERLLLHAKQFVVCLPIVNRSAVATLPNRPHAEAT